MTVRTETDPPSPPPGEEGAVMVTVALFLPVLILFASFAIDIGNAFVHDRHLQTQADAGALAAAGDFTFPCDNATIEATAREYAGDETGDYNLQMGGTSPEDVDVAINRIAFPGQPSNTDPTLESEERPCEAGLIDVKVNESGLPLFFSIGDLLDFVPFINAQARVEIFEQGSVQGALPLGVPDPNPQSARAIFLDEDGVFDSVKLERDEGRSGELTIWHNEAEPLPLTVDSERIEMRIALGGAESTECGDPLVACYDAETEGGILSIRGYSTAGSGAQPKPPLVRDAHLFSEACDDPYFNSEAAGCSVGLHAEVDFGPCEEIAEVGPELTALAGNEYPMALIGCPEESSTSEWETIETIPVPAGAGPVDVELEWAETKGEVEEDECKEGGGNKCTGSFGFAHSSFGGSNERSGPIRLAQVWRDTFTRGDSFERCSAVQPECTYPVVVEIGVEYNLLKAAQEVDEPLVKLRTSGEGAENNPSQTQLLDCDPSKNFKDEIASGCTPEYTINAGTECPSRGILHGSEEPWECVAKKTGEAGNPVYEGMNERVHGEKKPSECVNPNNWGDLPPGDPRILPMFITPFGSFSGTGGNETVPVTDFAVFYVTGWGGKGSKTSKDICPSDDPEEGELNAGEIVGHFIQYVQAFNDGSADEERECDFESDSLTPCVAVMTR